jgi:hypothetical protein
MAQSNELEDVQDGDEESSTPVVAPPPQLPVSAAPLNPQIQNYLAQLQAAQAQVGQNQMITGLTAAGQQLAHGIARAPGQANVEPTLQQAQTTDQAPLTQFNQAQAAKTQALQMQKAQDAQDPNSLVSQNFRKSLTLLNPNIAKVYGDDFNQLTPANSQDVRQILDTTAKLQEKSQEHRDTIDLKKVIAEGQGNRRDSAVDTKQQMRDEQDLAKAGKELNGLAASSRNALGTANKAKISAQRLADIVSDPNATNQDLQSAYSDLNQIVSGASTISGSEHQSYNTLNNQLASALQYITSNPQAPNIPEIKAHVKDVARRMTQISDQVIDKNTRIVQAAHPGLVKRMPGEWGNLINQVSSEPAAAGPDVILIKDPQGNVRKIPASQKDAALKAGGVLVP